MVTALRGNRRGAEGKIRSMCSVVSLGDVDTYRTPALSSTDALWLKDEGFTVAQTLVVLQRTGRVSTPSVPTVVCRNETSRHLLSPKREELLRALLAIDAASFPAPWNLDAPAFRHIAVGTEGVDTRPDRCSTTRVWVTVKPSSFNKSASVEERAGVR